MGRSWDLDEELDHELDALLDAPGGGLPDERHELAPLVEVAAALRAELAAVELDPGLAHQHVGRAVGAPRLRPAVVPVRSLHGSNSVHGSAVRMGTEVPAAPAAPPVGRPARFTLRRRVAVLALAAALLLVPATMASTRALPGQPLYPLKRSVEQVRLAALGWSPAASARERLRIADVRSSELASLLARGDVGRVPGAIVALRSAVDAAWQAVDEASFRDVDSSRAVALLQDFAAVQDRQIIQLTRVSGSIQTSSPAAEQAIETATSALASAKKQKQKQQQQQGARGGGRPAPTSPTTPPTSPTVGALLPDLATTVTAPTAGAPTPTVATATTPTATAATATTAAVAARAAAALLDCGDRPKKAKEREDWAECMAGYGQPVDPADVAAAEDGDAG